MSIMYRADIDGLRALAVIFVVLFHNFSDFASGGFIGVDIFFVISGYLITKIILSEIETENFSFLNFYNRRIRRILPSLLLLFIFSMLIGTFLLDEVEYKMFGLSLFSGTFFIENFLLYSQVGYFDWSSYFKPLLHLWSLSIEEQFYLFIPIIIYFSKNRKYWLKILLTAIFLLSLLSCIFYSYFDQQMTFYVTPFRIWEILIGSLIALYIRNFEIDNASSNIISLTSLAVLFFCFSFYNPSSIFPGWRSIFPVAATGLIIAFGFNSLVNQKILSNKFLVFVGKISYPLYLYHWTIISFVRIREGGNPSLIIRWIVILLSAYLSYLTYRFVETKIRNQKSALVPLFLSFGLFILGLGGIKIYFDGGLLFPNLFFVKAINKGATDATDVLKYLSETTVSCNSDIFPEASKENGLNCGQSQPGKPEILILGDSHAQHLFAGIHEANPNRNIAYATTAVPSSLTSALPLFEHPLFKEIYQNIFAEKSVRAVILNASWAAKIGQIPPSVNLGIELERIAQALEQQGKKLYLVTDVPNFPFHAGRCKYNGRLGSSSKCSMSQSDLDRQYQSYIGYLRTVEREYSNVELIDISYKFCNGVSCEMAQSGNLLYYDGGHLSVYGSKLAFTKTIE